MSVVAFDTETALIQPGILAPRLVCGSIGISGTGGLTEASVYSRPVATKWIGDALDSSEHIVGANVAFDMAVVAAADASLVKEIFRAYDEGRIHDTHVRQALDAIAKGHLNLDPRTLGPLTDPETGKRKERYSLAICCDLVLGRKVAKLDTFRMKYATLEHVPIRDWPADALEYSASDAKNTLDLFEAQERGFENLKCEADEVRAAFALHLMSVWGMRTDPAKVEEVAARVETLRAANTAKFKAAGILREDGTKDTKFLADRITAAFKGNPPLTETGRVKADRDTLSESGDELLEAFADAGENEKLFTTYLTVLRQGTKVPINASYNVLVASGRTSCTRPNLQNLPREGGVRECFVARPGFVFCSVDFAALELCTLAQVLKNLFGRSSMADAINAGADLHSELAAQFAGISVAEVPKELRQAAKAANFGFPGGMGAAKLVLAKRKEGLTFCHRPDCGGEKVTEWKGRPCPAVCLFCTEVAESLRNAWFARWPEMKGYFEHVAREAEIYGYIEFCGFKRGGISFTDGANHRFQHLAARLAKRATWEVTRECYTDTKSPLWNCRPVAFIHDELFSELVESRAHEAAQRKTQIMIAAARRYCPDVAIKAEPALCRWWFKKAEPVFDSNGRLIPWEPKTA